MKAAISDGAPVQNGADLIDLSPTTNGRVIPSAPPVINGVRKVKSQARTVKDWSVDDVCDWLSSLGLSKLSTIFKMNDIDGIELLELNKDVLETDLKISKCDSCMICTTLPTWLHIRSMKYRGFISHL